MKLPALMRATRDAGFVGAYVVEIFSVDVADSLYEDGDALLVRSREGMERAWAASFE